MNDHEFNITIWRKPTSMRDHEVYITIKCKCGKTIYIKKENYHCQIFYGLFNCPKCGGKILYEEN